MSNNNSKEKDVKEEFCAPCLSLLPAGLGLAGVGLGVSAKKTRKWKNIVLWSSVALTVVSIAVFILWKRKCTSCR